MGDDGVKPVQSLSKAHHISVVPRRARRDHGFAWVVAVAAMFSHMLQYGVVWTVGVFYVVFLENIKNNGAGEVAMISSLNTAVFYGVGPVAGVLTNMYGARAVGMAGGLLGSLGLVLSMFANSVHHLYATFGIITGAGLGLAFMPTIAAVTCQFDKYTSLALGLATSGVGIGTFVFPPLIRWLDWQYGWRGVLLLVGGISMHLIVLCALYRPMPPLHDTDPDKRRQTGGFRDQLNIHIFKNTSYILLLIQIVVASFGLSVVYVHLAAYAGTLGYSDDSSAMLFSTMGISNFLGRLAYGAVNQLPWVSPHYLYILGFVLSGMLTVACPLFTNYIAMQAYAALFGFFTACFGTILPQVIIHIVGADLITNAYGYVLLFMAIGTLAGGPTAGLLYDFTQKYTISLYLGGGAMTAGTLLLFIPLICKPRSRSRATEVHTPLDVKEPFFPDSSDV